MLHVCTDVNVPRLIHTISRHRVWNPDHYAYHIQLMSQNGTDIQTRFAHYIQYRPWIYWYPWWQCLITYNKYIVPRGGDTRRSPDDVLYIQWVAIFSVKTGIQMQLTIQHRPSVMWYPYIICLPIQQDSRLQMNTGFNCCLYYIQ